jgi:alkanesulfonate monooxygenase SsuD/methylene tetrahydromethanopterin reductase-like flavin-dependent oxidoreductase (luciferase family)
VVTLELGYFINPEYESSYPIDRALREQRSTVALAQELGMTATFVGEHFSFGNFAWLPPMMLLTKVHDAAPEMMFGTAVLSSPLHRPAVLAEQAAFLDAATGGRFVLGLAAGWNPFEFETMGEPLKGRGRRLEEAVAVMRRLWASPEPADFDGPTYPYRNLSLGLRPARAGGPPIWLGGSSRVALDRAARIGDSWIISSHTPSEAALGQVGIYHERLTAAGRRRPAVRPGLRNVFVARTHEEAIARCRPYLTASYSMFNKWGLFTDVLKEPTQEVDFERASERALIGSVEEVAEELTRFILPGDLTLLLARSQWLGIPHKYIDESMVLLATEVLPLVNAELAKARPEVVAP